MDNEITDGQVAATEKMLPQSQVNELIGGAKAAAADKAARETEARLQAEYEAKLQSVSLDKEALFSEWEQREAAKKQAATEKAREIEVQQKFDEVLKKYDQKLYESRDIAPDFEEVIKKFPHKTHQALIIGTADLPNTGEVMLYLARNPGKAFTLNQMAEANWDGLVAELNAISKTLESQRASVNNKVKAPLSKLKSDVVGLNNGGKSTLEELRREKRSFRLN